MTGTTGRRCGSRTGPRPARRCMWTQIVGKIRLAQAPMVNHWWQVTLYVTPRGLTTSAMPDGDRVLRDRVRLRRPPAARSASSGGERREIALEPKTVADFYARDDGRAGRAGRSTSTIWPRPGRGRAGDPVRRGHRARRLRPRRGAAVLAPARAGRPGDDASSARASSARSARCTSSGARMDLAVHAVLRAAPRRRTPAARPTAPTG